MGAISDVTALVFTVSGTITIVAGIYMALRMRWGHLDTWFDTGWGWAIFIGGVMAIIAMGLGGATGATAKRMGALSGSIEGRAPTPEEAGQMQALGARLNSLSRIATVLVIIALGAMASARFV